MAENPVMRGFPWPCEKCRGVLGYIHRDEIEIELEHVSRVQTKEGAIIIQCSKCGSLKTWFDRPEVQLKGGLRTILRAVAEESLTQQKAMIDQLAEKIDNFIVGTNTYDVPVDNYRSQKRKVRGQRPPRLKGARREMEADH